MDRLSDSPTSFHSCQPMYSYSISWVEWHWETDVIITAKADIRQKVSQWWQSRGARIPNIYVDGRIVHTSWTTLCFYDIRHKVWPFQHGNAGGGMRCAINRPRMQCVHYFQPCTYQHQSPRILGVGTRVVSNNLSNGHGLLTSSALFGPMWTSVFF